MQQGVMSDTATFATPLASAVASRMTFGQAVKTEVLFFDLIPPILNCEVLKFCADKKSMISRT